MIWISLPCCGSAYIILFFICCWLLLNVLVAWCCSLYLLKKLSSIFDGLLPIVLEKWRCSGYSLARSVIWFGSFEASVPVWTNQTDCLAGARPFEGGSNVTVWILVQACGLWPRGLSGPSALLYIVTVILRPSWLLVADKIYHCTPYGARPCQ